MDWGPLFVSDATICTGASALAREARVDPPRVSDM